MRSKFSLIKNDGTLLSLNSKFIWLDDIAHYSSYVSLCIVDIHDVIFYMEAHEKQTGVCHQHHCFNSKLGANTRLFFLCFCEKRLRHEYQELHHFSHFSVEKES